MVVIDLEHLFWKSITGFLVFKLHIVFSYSKSRSTFYMENPHRITDTRKTKITNMVRALQSKRIYI